MLYSLLAAVLILSFLMPVMCYLSFVKGLSIKGEKVDVTALKLPHIRHKAHKSKAIKEYDTYMHNIDAYDGTSFGQKEFDKC